jgi:predicted 3-demethylubiquinone-9 3-methyltransferase (glyoxalase superfamily)
MATPIQKISTMIWFDNQAEEAAKFYTTTFPNSQTGRITRYGKEGIEIHGQKEGTLMTIDFAVDGQKFTALNGGPHFKINPAISFFVTYEKESQVDAIWKNLTQGGAVLMPLDKYPWSEKYGWLQDRYGVSWQIAMGARGDVGGQSVVPSLMFVKERYGHAEKAMNLYTSVFKNSKIEGVLRYGADQLPEKEGTVQHAQFTLGNQTFMVMDSAMDHQFTFNEAISLIVNCDTQEEIDYYWGKLSEGGDPKAQMCGWLKDKFGVSWQIVPAVLENMLQDRDKAKMERVTRAYLKMKKFDIKELKKAFEGK